MATTLDLLWAIRDLRDDRLRSRHLGVLAGLLMHRGGDGTARKPWRIDPSIEQLANAVKMNRTTVHRGLADLQKWGFVQVRRRGAHRPSLYELSLPETSRAAISHAATSQAMSPVATGPVAACDARGVDLPPSADLFLRISPEDPGHQRQAPHGPRAAEKPEAGEAPTEALAAPSRKSRSGRGTRLDAEWVPSATLLAKLRRDLRVDGLGSLERFRNHWISKSRDALKLDWDRTFANWVEEDARRGRASPIGDEDLPILRLPNREQLIPKPEDARDFTGYSFGATR